MTNQIRHNVQKWGLRWDLALYPAFPIPIFHTASDKYLGVGKAGYEANVQKCENRPFLKQYNSGTTMSPKLFLGMAVIEG